MPGPWESFQKPTQSEGESGPWTKYQSPTETLDFSTMSPVQRTFLLRQPEPETAMRKLGTMAKEGALPALGQVGGAALGGLAASPTVAGVPAGVLAGEAAGSALGEIASQKLGLKERSVTDEPGVNWKEVGLAGAAPGIGRGLYAAGKGLVTQGARMLPGAGAGLQEWAGQQAMKSLDWLKGRIGDSEKLYRIVEQYNPVIPTTHTMKALQDLNAHYATNVPHVMEGAAPVQEVQRLTQGLMQEMRGGAAPSLSYHNPAMSFQKLRGSLKLMNEDYGTSSGTLRHAYGEIRKAIMRDMEEAAAKPTNTTEALASTALKAANQAFRKNMAYDELKDVIINKAIGPPRSGDLMQGFNRRAVMKALSENETITKNLSPVELSVLRMNMEKLGTIPALPPAPGQHVGSSRTLMSGAIGGLGGFLSPYPGGAAVGSAAGPLLMEAISKLAETEAGKRMIVKAATAKGPAAGPALSALIAAALSGSSRVNPSGMTVQPFQNRP